MAFVIGPKHGGIGAAAVCSHVAAKVAAGIPIDRPLHSISASYEGQTRGPTWVCTSCAGVHHVPEEGLRLSGEEGVERFWTEIGFTPVCPRCLVAVCEAIA